jgi:hypothetical protein
VGGGALRRERATGTEGRFLEETMAGFKMRGTELLDGHSHKIATVRGNDILDEHSHKVATVRANDILDEHNHKISTLRDVKKTIDGAMGGVTVVALWLFFVR